MARRGPLPAAALVTVALSLGAFLLAGGVSGPDTGARAGLSSAAITKAHQRQLLDAPVAFAPSTGNALRSHRFLAGGPGYDLFTASDGWRMVLRDPHRTTLTTKLIGASSGPGAGVGRLKATVSVLHGSDRSSWRVGIPTFRSVRYRNVYPGVDLLYHGGNGALEYDFQLAPGVRASRVRMRVDGVRRLRLTREGDLLIPTGAGTVRQHAPVAYQVANGARSHVDARFVLDGNTLRFKLGRYDKARSVVIDPSLEFGDYVGGTSVDVGQKVAIDGSGNIYVAGNSSSASIPGATVARSKSTGQDGFVMKLSPTGARQWISYVGGNASDFVTDMALDGSGRPYITGYTDSTNFPGTSAKLGVGDGLRDAFIARLTTDGGLSYGSYAGTAATGDEAYGIAVEGTGAAYIADILTNYDGVTHQPTDTFGNVVRFNAGGTPDWYIPFDEADTTIKNEAETAVAVPQGCQTNCDLFIAGRTTFTGTGGPYAIAEVFKYHTDAVPANVHGLWGPSYYTTTMNPQDPQNPETSGGETPTSMAVDSHGNPAIVGVKTVDQNTHYGFAARFDGATGAHDPILLSWQFPAALNGASNNFDIAFDPQDNIYIVGNTTASNDDTTDAIQGYKGSNDAFVVKYFPAGYPGDNHDAAHIVWGTYLGGGAHDYAYGVVADSSGGTYVTGETQSADFIGSPLSQPKSSSSDAFLVKIRTNSPTVTDGPGDVTATPDVTFKYTAHETAGTFECRLVGAGSPSPSFTTCGLQSQSFTGLADGAYTFEVKAFDAGGSTNGGVTRRAFTVDTALKPAFSIAPNPALVGRTVTFDGSGSNSASHTISKYEWDLDGNGSYETSSGGTATITQTYPSAGTFKVGLRVTDRQGATGTTTNTLQVNNATIPGVQFGVTINDGAQFTNDPNVTVTATFPTFTTGLLFSNDGGFGKAQTFAAKKQTPWKLDSSGPERLPKTIYVRFLTGSIPSNNFQDDIILDETPPKVDDAEIDPVGGEAAPAGAAAAAAKLHKYRVKMKARDKTSGVSKVQVTSNKKKPGKALKYKRKFVVKSAKKPKWVRARDRAGNWSKWKKAR